MKKKYTLLQTVANYSEYLELTKNHIIPLSIVVTRKQLNELPMNFTKLYSKSWMSMGLYSDPIYFGLNGEALLRLMKKIKLEYIIFNNGEVKKIDKFYPIKENENQDVKKRKKYLIKKNKVDDKCILSFNNSLWQENEYFNTLKDSLSDAAIKTYKKMND